MIIGGLFGAGAAHAGLDVRERPAVSRLHARHRQRLSLHARGLYGERSELHRQGDGADAVGQERRSGSSTTSCPTSSACSTASSTASPATTTTIYPKALRAEIDRLNDLIYPNVNNGVYRCGFAKTQAAYEAAYDALFATLDELEARLGAPALSGRPPDHRGRLAAAADAAALRRRLFLAVPLQHDSGSPTIPTCTTTCCELYRCRASPRP